MGAFVYLQILRAGKQFAAPRERTGERFFPGMHTQMVDQFVFGLEGEPCPGTVFPVANVLRALVDADMVLGQMLHNVHHDEELLAAGLALGRAVDPHAADNLGQRLSEVAV